MEFASYSDSRLMMYQEYKGDNEILSHSIHHINGNNELTKMAIFSLIQWLDIFHCAMERIQKIQTLKLIPSNHATQAHFDCFFHTVFTSRRRKQKTFLTTLKQNGNFQLANLFFMSL